MSTEKTQGKTEEQLKAEQTAATEAKEAEQGFAAGFEKVSGPKADDKPSDKTSEKSDAEREAEATAERERQALAAAEAKAKAEDEAKAKAQADNAKFLEGLPNRLRSIEGHIGGLKGSMTEMGTKLDTSLATAKAAAERKGGDGAAPADAQVAAAMSDPEAWKRLKEDFPDWAGPVEKEFASMRAELAKGAKPAVDVEGLKKEVKGEIDNAVSQVLDTAEERAFVRLKHPDWKATVKTDDFKAWLASQPDDVKTLTSSDKGDDAVKLLDSYAEHRKAASATADERKRRESRLRGGLVPEGTGGDQKAGLSDDEALARGFKRAQGK